MVGVVQCKRRTRHLEARWQALRSRPVAHGRRRAEHGRRPANQLPRDKNCLNGGLHSRPGEQGTAKQRGCEKVYWQCQIPRQKHRQHDKRLSMVLKTGGEVTLFGKWKQNPCIVPGLSCLHPGTVSGSDGNANVNWSSVRERDLAIGRIPGCCGNASCFRDSSSMAASASQREMGPQESRGCRMRAGVGFVGLRNDSGAFGLPKDRTPCDLPLGVTWTVGQHASAQAPRSPGPEATEGRGASK